MNDDMELYARIDTERLDTLTNRLLIWNILTYIICLVFNGLQSKFSKYSIGEISSLYRSPLSPAGFAFGIWGVIYLGLTAFVCYHFYVVARRLKERLHHFEAEERQMDRGAARELGLIQADQIRNSGRVSTNLASNNSGTPARVISSAPVRSSLQAQQRVLVDGIGIWFGIANLLNALWVPVFVQGTIISIGVSAWILIGLLSCLLKIQISNNHWWRKLRGCDHCSSQRPPATLLGPNEETMPPTIGGSSPPTLASEQIHDANDVERNANPRRSNPNTISPGDIPISMRQDRAGGRTGESPMWELLVVDCPFSIYLGWTTVAAILNITIWCEQWLRLDESLGLAYALVTLVLADMVFGLVYLRKMRNFASALIFTWATLAIWKNTSKSCPKVRNFDEKNCELVGITALVLGILMGVACVRRLFRFLVTIR